MTKLTLRDLFSEIKTFFLHAAKLYHYLIVDLGAKPIAAPGKPL